MLFPFPIPDLPDIPNSSAQSESVSASGGSHASAHVVNIVNANSNTGGKATVHIETDSDGEHYEETIEKDIGPDEDVSIDIATSSSNGRASVSSEVHINANHSDNISEAEKIVKKATTLSKNKGTSGATATLPVLPFITPSEAPSPEEKSGFFSFFNRIFGFILGW